MQQIPEQLAAALPAGTVHLHSPVARIAPGEVHLADGRIVHSRSVIVATDGPTASRLLGEQRPDVRDPGDRSVRAVWFEAPAPPVSHRFIVLDGTSSGPALNVVPMSNVAPGYAGDTGKALIVAACPIGVTRADGTVLIDEVPDDWQLEQLVRRQLLTWWGPQVDRWRVLRVDTIAHGQPDSQPPFRPKRAVSLGDGLFVCGDHRDTPSIQGAMHSGRRTGEAVLES